MSCAAHIAASGPVEGGCLAREHAGEAPRAPKLIDVVRNALRARHYSRRTEKAYIGWIRRYILFHGKRHPRELVRDGRGKLALGPRWCTAPARIPRTDSPALWRRHEPPRFPSRCRSCARDH
ncbi:MAG: hypothetical protein E6J59_06185, partial [Deltaproteobacteria bacterium]